MSSNNKVIAIFGGSFNPPHKAHHQIAINIIKFDKPSELIIIPSKNPLKKNYIDTESNAKLIESTFENIERTIIDWNEYYKKKSYSIDYLLRIKNSYPIGSKFKFYIGSDLLNDFKKWKDYLLISELVDIIVIYRLNDEIKNIKNLKNYSKRYWDLPNISSSYLRQNYSEKKIIKKWLIPATWKIFKNIAKN